MKANATAKRVHENGMDLIHYRFVIEYKDHTGKEKKLVRWASSAENAILSVAHQYHWMVELTSPVAEDDYCKMLIGVWVPNARIKGMRFPGTDGCKYTYRVEAYQRDLH